MPQGPGWPSKLFPPYSTGLNPLDKQYGGTVLIQVPSIGQENIAGGATLSPVTQQTGLLLVAVYADVPAGTTATLTLNGSTYLQSLDNQGLIGQLKVGDFAARVGFPVQSYAFTATNNNTAGRDVRFWLVGFPL